MPAGRPTKYDPSINRQVRNLCLLGATIADLAAAFEVDEATIYRWQNAHPEFREAQKEGREQADARVAKSLYHRALGYKHKAVKIFADAKTGAVTEVPYVEHYPPDTTAAIFWLKNRRPDLWRDRHEITGKDGVPVIPPSVTLRLVKAEGDAGGS